VFDRIREARKNESGFTLIELLIVIVILGVLSAIVVFGVNGITSKGDAAACKSDVKNVEIAAQAFYAQKGTGATAVGATGSAVATELTGSGLLLEAPSNTKYAITLTGGAAGNAGTVNVTPACSTLS
jgi:prepilin-type N-terminal cleavage/methylation domain-containing protein